MTTAEIAPYQPAGDAGEYRPRIIMGTKEAKALDDQLRATQLAVLRKGTDYDTIPGMGERPTLLKPGAEKLLQWFGFGFTNDCTGIERDDDGRRAGVTYRCIITKGLPDGRTVTVATCEGYAGYDEERFYQSAEQAWAKECSAADRYKRQPRKWKAVEYRAPWNTVLKMSQKRALVGAAIDATAAAGLFTQDLEDMTPPPGTEDGNGSAAPPDDAWDNATPARPAEREQEKAPPDDGWTMTRALKTATGFDPRDEPEGTRLWLETAKALRDGKATPKQRDKIQNIINARIAKQRQKAAGEILGGLDDGGGDWGPVILELAGDQAARDLIAELRQQATEGQMPGDRADLLATAALVMRPKAAEPGPEATEDEATA